MAGENQKRLEAKSADYVKMQTFWQDTADFLEGEDAVIQAGKRYLPRYPDETDEEYAFRLLYAKLTNHYRDVIEGLAAKPFERPIVFDPPLPDGSPFADIADDVDGSGVNQTVFAMDHFFYAIGQAVDFIMVDMPPVPPKRDNAGNVIPRSLAEEKALGIRPLWSRISVLNIYEIVTKIIRGKEQITYCRIFEPANGGRSKQFRECSFDDKTGQASWQIWEWSEGVKDYIPTESGIFSIGLIPIVPLHLGRRKGTSFQYYPPMKDALSLQKKLYRKESNLELAEAYTAYPMLVGQGVKPELDASNKPLKVIRGPGITLYAPNTPQGGTSDWKFIEPSATSLTFLQSGCDKTAQNVRELGKQPLTVSSGNLTTITTAVAAGKAKSAVKAWAGALGDAFTVAWYYTALWMGAGEQAPRPKVYDEFDEFLEPGADMQALQFAVENGHISSETYLGELVRRKVLSPDFNIADEREKIMSEIPLDGGIDNDPLLQPDNLKL